MVSVIIPSYNRANSIEKCVRSVLNQTYKDIEVIIVDDCSTDNTETIICNLRKEDSRITYIRHEINRGACVARNTGIKAASGEYIAFQDSDDTWYPEKLSKQLNVIQSAGADIVFCKYLFIKEGENSVVRPKYYSEGYLNPVIDLYEIGTQTLLAHNYVFKECMFDPEMPRLQDFELLLRIAEKYRIYCLDEPLVNYYVGDDSISTKPERFYAALNMILEKHPDFSKKYPVMGKRFAISLRDSAHQIAKKQYIKESDVYLIAKKYDSSLKNKCIILLMELGIYDKLHNLKEIVISH